MCGKSYDPRIIVAWATAKIAVMVGEQAANVLLQIEKGKKEDVEEGSVLDKIKRRYDVQSSPYYAASRLWIDAIIDPLDTRKIISNGIKAANNAQINESYNPGIIQT